MVEKGNGYIAFVLSSLKFGGGERVALNLAHAFRERGIKVVFLLMSREGEFLPEALQYFNVVDLRCDRTWKLPGKLATFLRKEKPDALISSFWKLNLCACLSRVARPSVRLLLWEHSPPSKSANSPTWLYGITASIFYRISTKIIAVSTGVYDDIASITFGLRYKLKVIFNPVLPPPVSLKITKNTDLRRIIWVGRMDYPKNPALMLEVFMRLPKDEGYSLDFIGDGPLKQVLEERVVKNELEGIVRFHSFQPNPYLWMAKADILVLTSDREGLPTVLIEALYCGLRIVSTDCGTGVRDVLLDNHYGTIVPVGNVEELTSAIIAISKKPYNIEEQIIDNQKFLPKIAAERFIDIIYVSR